MLHYCSPQRTFVFAAALFAASLASHHAAADSADARCDIYPKGEDYATASIPCVFSQRQGYISIRRSDGVVHDLSPQDDAPGHFRDTEHKDVYRQNGLGKDGLIFRLANESIYVYWDTAGLPGSNAENSMTAPYGTDKFDATARLPCTLSGQLTAAGEDCAMGVIRGPNTGQALVKIMRSDGVERVMQFDGDSVTSPGGGKIRVQKQSDEWTVTIDDTEAYLIVDAVILGG